MGDALARAAGTIIWLLIAAMFGVAPLAILWLLLNPYI